LEHTKNFQVSGVWNGCSWSKYSCLLWTICGHVRFTCSSLHTVSRILVHIRHLFLLTHEFVFPLALVRICQVLYTSSLVMFILLCWTTMAWFSKNINQMKETITSWYKAPTQSVRHLQSNPVLVIPFSTVLTRRRFIRCEFAHIKKVGWNVFIDDFFIWLSKTKFFVEKFNSVIDRDSGVL